MEKLYRSKTDRVLGGVAGGLSQYFQVDSVIIRLLLVLLALAEGNALLFYLIAWLIIPEEPGFSEGGGHIWEASQHDPRSRRRLFGGLLIIAGLVFLARQASIWIDPVWLVSIGLIAAGIAVLLRGRR
ncbi:MAG: PspC domain-containing protein [Firmicutes bacterium]|jgi:phage shock protein C|nr:PspC domain-containing protein [Bacillota bacterium]